MDHLPILRAGVPYRSLDMATVPHFQTGEPMVAVSQANRGLIARDLQQCEANRQSLMRLSVKELLEICTAAARHFVGETLPLGDASQSPDDYIHQLSATTGMPEAVCIKNMAKIEKVLSNMAHVLGGLTRNLDLAVLDTGYRHHNGSLLSYTCETTSLGAILPNNSPGVHSLWLTAIPLKVPLVLKPGSQEPWTPYRVAQALLAAGCPPQAVSYYPTDYSGAAEILLRCGRSMLFGDRTTVSAWAKDPRVQIHGPGWSKLMFGPDTAADWQDHLDVIESSVVENCGRSCINASGVWTPSHGRDLADALARRLAGIGARKMTDKNARLAAFANKTFAEKISYMIDSQLAIPGAEDLTARHRDGDRLVEAHGTTYLLPTVIYCDDPGHPLANSEFLFPFVSVVEAPLQQLLQGMGPTLVLTAITEDRPLIRELFQSPHVDRLNIGAIPTNQIGWDQPHEGNLFDHLYRQRALQLSDPEAVLTAE